MVAAAGWLLRVFDLRLAALGLALLVSLAGQWEAVAATPIQPTIPTLSPAIQVNADQLSAPIPALPSVAQGAALATQAGVASSDPELLVWYDDSGLRTWIHIVNPGSAAINATVELSGGVLTATKVSPGSDSYLELSGSVGGPVQVRADGPFVASARTSTAASMGEVAARPASAAAPHLGLSWFDGLGMRTWIHLANPGEQAASATVTVAGQKVWSGLVPGHGEAHTGLPGISGGPVVIDSDQPVLGSERSLLGGSFWELPAQALDTLPADAWYAWYDASAGLSDVHLTNPRTTTASVHLSLAGAELWSGGLASGEHRVLSFKGRSGGPLHLTSSTPVLATVRSVLQRRVPEFQEHALVSAAAAAAAHWSAWYDYASPGVYEDIHVTAPVAPAAVTISIAGKTVWAGTVAQGSDTHQAFPGIRGGPVYVAASSPVLVWQRSLRDPPTAPTQWNVVITVDDCGTAPAMHAIIQTIAAKHLPAIFFPTGQCRDANPWLVPEIQAAGYQACNHTYSHQPLTNLWGARLYSEIAGGVHTSCNLLRPPYGAWDGVKGHVAQAAAALGYKIFLWDIDTGDYYPTTDSDFMLGKMRGHSGVVLMHFQGQHTLETLQRM